SELDAGLRRHTRVALSHAALNVDGASGSIDRADKFDQHAVAGTFYDPALILRDCGVEKLPPVGVQPRQRAFLVFLHEPAVADHVAAKNRAQAPLNPLAGHAVPRTDRPPQTFLRKFRISIWQCLSAPLLPTHSRRLEWEPFSGHVRFGSETDI